MIQILYSILLTVVLLSLGLEEAAARKTLAAIFEHIYQYYSNK